MIKKLSSNRPDQPFHERMGYGCYELDESIYGAEASPLTAYFIGLAAIQSAVALAAMFAARAVAQRQADVPTLRLVGTGIAGIGLAVLMQQVIPAV